MEPADKSHRNDTLSSLQAHGATESTRYLGETAFGTVEKVYAVCAVINDQVADPKKIERIYNYIQDMFGSDALEYEQPHRVILSTSRMPGEKALSGSPELRPFKEPLW